MQVLAAIPVLGPILTGPRGEGVFGITFAIKGTMANPQVVVNPLALLTPGIFREIFQMTPEDPRVVPRDRPIPKGERRARLQRAGGRPARRRVAGARRGAGGRRQLVGGDQRRGQEEVGAEREVACARPPPASARPI